MARVYTYMSRFSPLRPPCRPPIAPDASPFLERALPRKREGKTTLHASTQCMERETEAQFENCSLFLLAHVLALVTTSVQFNANSSSRHYKTTRVRLSLYVGLRKTSCWKQRHA